MKNKILYTSILLCLLLAESVTAQNFNRRKIYVDPGHDSYGAEDRGLATINYAQGNTNSFWESSASLKKGLALQKWLEAANADVRMSRTTQISVGSYTVSQRAAAASSWGASVLWSLHSNAFNYSTNYPLVIFRSTSAAKTTPVYTEARTLGQAVWPKCYENTLSSWTYNTMNVRGDCDVSICNLGVLGCGRMACLLEGTFHDYGPERHRLMSQAYCAAEAWNVLRGFCVYYGLAAPSKGAIVGFAKDQAKSINASTVPARQDAYNTTTVRDHDKYWPINGCKVELMSGTSVLQTYTTDGFYNGIFGFFDVTPGTYTLRYTANGYNCVTASVTVAAAGYTCVKQYLTQGSGGPCGIIEPEIITSFVVGQGENAPYTPLLTTPYTINLASAIKMVSTGVQSTTGAWEVRSNNFTWTSSDTKVATVNSIGQVTGVNNGTTTIKAVVTNGGTPATSYATNSSLSYTLTVTGGSTTPVAVTGVSVSPSTLSLGQGGTSTLTATVSPSNATNKNINWSSNNTSIATVDNGKITAIAAGMATITATSNENTAIKANCTVTVTATDQLTANGQLTLKIVPFKSTEQGGTAVTDPDATSITNNSTTAGCIFINNTSSGQAVTRGEGTTYICSPASVIVNQYGTINTTGVSDCMLTVKVVNGTMEGIIKIAIGNGGGVGINNAAEKDAINVRATGTGIAVQFEGDALIELYTVNGILIDKTQASQSYSHDLVKGVYIIRVNGQTKKFVK